MAIFANVEDKVLAMRYAAGLAGSMNMNRRIARLATERSSTKFRCKVMCFLWPAWKIRAYKFHYSHLGFWPYSMAWWPG